MQRLGGAQNNQTKANKLEVTQVLSRPSENSSSETAQYNNGSRMQMSRMQSNNATSFMPGSVIQRIIQNNMDESKFDKQRQQAANQAQQLIAKPAGIK